MSLYNFKTILDFVFLNAYLLVFLIIYTDRKNRHKKCSHLSPLIFLSFLRRSTSPRSILIDQKIFTIFPDASSWVTRAYIKEQGRSITYFISLSWSALEWLTSSFNFLWTSPCNFKFFKKLETTHYSWKSLVTKIWLLVLLQHSGRRMKLFILSKKNKNGWFSFSLISNYNREPPSSVRNQQTFREVVQQKVSLVLQPKSTAPTTASPATLASTVTLPHQDWVAMVVVQRHQLHDP